MSRANYDELFDHLVVLMLENRSFDNVCGYLYAHDEPKHFVPDEDRVFRGVAGRDDLVNDGGGDPPREYRVRVAPWNASRIFTPRTPTPESSTLQTRTDRLAAPCLSNARRTG